VDFNRIDFGRLADFACFIEGLCLSMIHKFIARFVLQLLNSFIKKVEDNTIAEFGFPSENVLAYLTVRVLLSFLALITE